MRMLTVAHIAALTMSWLTGCGLKGPLTLPQTPKPPTIERPHNQSPLDKPTETPTTPPTKTDDPVGR